MRDRIVQVATYGWMVAIALCFFGPVKVFGPLAISLLGVALSADTSEKVDRTGLLMLTLMTAVAVFLGVQQYEKALAQKAYWAHRQYIGCKDADRWEAMGGRKDYPYRIPTDDEIRRCSEIDDSLDFQVLLETNGW